MGHFYARLDEIIVCNCQDKNDLKTDHVVIGGLLQQSGTYNQFSYVKALNLLFSQVKVWSSKLNMFYPILMMTIF